MIDLHSLTPATAKVALVTWFRYLRFLAAPHGGANPWPERKTAVVVTGAHTAASQMFRVSDVPVEVTC